MRVSAAHGLCEDIYRESQKTWFVRSRPLSARYVEKTVELWRRLNE